jgi:hypothetical protein
MDDLARKKEIHDLAYIIAREIQGIGEYKQKGVRCNECKACLLELQKMVDKLIMLSFDRF